MKVLTTSIKVIDYENNAILSRVTPETFDAYVLELITHINSNTTVRGFKTRSPNTEVITSIKLILKSNTDGKLVERETNTIANRLLIKEVEAQRRVAKMNTSVQKGSLIQALLLDEDNNHFVYLLAKVEHTSFVDDSDFTFRSGFSKEKKFIWKSCLLDMPNENATEFYAKIYSNTVAKYWSDDFLELDEMIDDEKNTLTAFKSIESTLNRNIRSAAPSDYTVLRNSVVSYFKNRDHLDYNVMIQELFENYQVTDLDIDKLHNVIEKLRNLPELNKFDRQFTPIPAVIDSKIKKVYEVNNGIQLRITDGIDNIQGTITSIRDESGTNYIRIITNNDATFKAFSINRQN